MCGSGRAASRTPGLEQSKQRSVPVIVTENGMATGDDGVDVRGYLHWTLLDNFEWMSGYANTFGLIAFDHETFVRTVKPSARWLGEVARSKGASVTDDQPGVGGSP